MSKKSSITLAQLSILGKNKAEANTSTAPVETVVLETAPEVEVTASPELVADAPLNETAAPVVEAKADASGSEIVKMRMPEGSREHGTTMANGDKRWVIAPKFKGSERWFDRTKIAGYGKDDKGFFVTLTRKEVAQREMQHLIEAEPAAAEAAAE